MSWDLIIRRRWMYVWWWNWLKAIFCGRNIELVWWILLLFPFWCLEIHCCRRVQKCAVLCSDAISIAILENFSISWCGHKVNVLSNCEVILYLNLNPFRRSYLHILWPSVSLRTTNIKLISNMSLEWGLKLPCINRTITSISTLTRIN